MKERPDLRALLVDRYGSVTAASRAANLKPTTLFLALEKRSAHAGTVRNIAQAYARNTDEYGQVLAFFGLSYLPEEGQ